MKQTNDYAVVRVNTDSYRLDRTSEPGAGAAAFIVRARDRLGNPSGWRFKPLVTMQGAKSRLWTSVAEVLAATKLMTPAQARNAVRAADVKRAEREGALP